MQTLRIYPYVELKTYCVFSSNCEFAFIAKMIALQIVDLDNYKYYFICHAILTNCL